MDWWRTCKEAAGQAGCVLSRHHVLRNKSERWKIGQIVGSAKSNREIVICAYRCGITNRPTEININNGEIE